VGNDFSAQKSLPTIQDDICLMNLLFQPGKPVQQITEPLVEIFDFAALFPGLEFFSAFSDFLQAN